MRNAQPLPRRTATPASLVLMLLFVSAATLSTGCATRESGMLPMGEWAGRGTFIYEEWAPGGPNGGSDFATSAPAEGTICRDYDTTLVIRPDKLGETDVVRAGDSLDARGELPNLSHETHLIAALVPGKRANDNSRLYRAIAMQLNPDDDDKLEPADDAPPFLATCFTHGDTTTFQIGYTENFVDVYRFQGWSVEKSGVYFDEKRGLVHWSEQLTRKR